MLNKKKEISTISGDVKLACANNVGSKNNNNDIGNTHFWSTNNSVSFGMMYASNNKNGSISQCETMSDFPNIIHPAAIYIPKIGGWPESSSLGNQKLSKLFS